MSKTQERQKLLITEDSLPVGGAETLLLQYLQHLDRGIFDVHLLTLRNRGELIGEAQLRADHYACADRRVGLDIMALLRLRKYLKRQGISVMHCNQWLDAGYFLIASLGLRVARVATMHGYNRTWRFKVHLRLLRYFDRVICVSRSQKIELYRLGLPWERLVVVNNCFDEKRFYPPKDSAERLERNPFRMVMVANFLWIKDQMTLIEALRILRLRGHAVELHLVGREMSECFEICRSRVMVLDLENCVTFITNKRVDGPFLHGFDAFVFSSLADTFGIALLEAMACGLPVLVSDIPSSMELIAQGRNGLFFETGNPLSCAAQIERLIKDRELRRTLSERALARAQDFRPERVTRDLEAVYAGLLKDSA